MEGTCQICNEAITNPVCIDCLTQEMQDWYRDDPASGMEVASTRDTFIPLADSGVRCIICKGPMAACAHCFAKDVRDLVEKKEEFSRLFNFHLA